MVLVLLKELGEEGDKLPEWEVGDPALYQELAQLAAPSAGATEPKAESLDVLLSTWETSNTGSPASVMQQKQTVVVTAEFAQTLSIQQIKNTQLDSDDDDDDDLPAYDMSHDVKVAAKDAPQLRYLRDVMDHLGEAGDTADPEECFRLLPALCEKQLAYEDPSVVEDLLGVMLYAENRFDTTHWVSLR